MFFELPSSPPLLAAQDTGMGSGQEEVVEWKLGSWAWTHKWKGKVICKIKQYIQMNIGQQNALLRISFGVFKISKMENAGIVQAVLGPNSEA